MTNSEARKRMTPTTDPCTLDAHVLAVTVRDLTATLERVRKVAEQCDPGTSREVLAALMPASNSETGPGIADSPQVDPEPTPSAKGPQIAKHEPEASKIEDGFGNEWDPAVAMSQSSVQVRLSEDEKAAISTYLHECHACRQGTIDVEPCTCRPWHEGIETVLAARVAAVTAERDRWHKAARAHSGFGGGPSCQEQFDAYRDRAEGAEAEVASLREQVAAVEALADDWEQFAGEASTRWQAYGPQKVSVPFAVREVREALTTPGEALRAERERVWTEGHDCCSYPICRENFYAGTEVDQ